MADGGNKSIRKIIPSGDVTTFAGQGPSDCNSPYSCYSDGTGTAAQFKGLSGIAVDKSGNVYVADPDNGRIRKMSPTGAVTTLAGSLGYGFTDGTGTTAKFANPNDIAVDSSGNVYVVDTGNRRIRKIQQQ